MLQAEHLIPRKWHQNRPNSEQALAPRTAGSTIQLQGLNELLLRNQARKTHHDSMQGLVGYQCLG